MAETKKVVATKKSVMKPAVAAKPTAKTTDKTAAVPTTKAAPLQKVTTVKKAVAPRATSKVAPKRSAASAPKGITHAEVVFIVTDEQRYRMIAEAAYYRAERHNFQSDHLRDWIEAERDIDMLLTGKR